MRARSTQVYAAGEARPPGPCTPLADGACLLEPARDTCPPTTNATPLVLPSTDATTPFTIVLEDDAALPLYRDELEVATRLADLFNAGVRVGAHVIYLGHCRPFLWKSTTEY